MNSEDSAKDALCDAARRLNDHGARAAVLDAGCAALPLIGLLEKFLQAAPDSPLAGQDGWTAPPPSELGAAVTRTLMKYTSFPQAICAVLSVAPSSFLPMSPALV